MTSKHKRTPTEIERNAALLGLTVEVGRPGDGVARYYFRNAAGRELKIARGKQAALAWLDGYSCGRAAGWAERVAEERSGDGSKCPQPGCGGRLWRGGHCMSSRCPSNLTPDGRAIGQSCACDEGRGCSRGCRCECHTSAHDPDDAGDLE